MWPGRMRRARAEPRPEMQDCGVVGNRVYIGHVDLVCQIASPNRIATRVSLLDFLGSFCRARLEPEVAPDVAILADFSANLMRDLGVAEGQKLTIALPPESLRVFAKS